MRLKSVTKALLQQALQARPHSTSVLTVEEAMQHQHHHQRTWEREEAKPYSEVPGPTALPFVGNSWRFAPIIGHYKIDELDKAMLSLRERYGKIVKVSGLLGHPDLVFAFTPQAVEAVFRKEEVLPHRPSMPSLKHYKQVLRKDFFRGDGNAGVIGVHGKEWDVFRAKVQQIMLQPSTAMGFVGPLNDIADDFLNRMDNMRDGNEELPDDFLFEIYKWALESIGRVALDTRLGCLEPTMNKDSEAQKIIDSVNTFFWNVSEVELRLPLWRVYKTKSYRKYISALDDFREVCLKHITTAVERLEGRMLSQSEQKDQDEVRRGRKSESIVEGIMRQHKDPRLAVVLALDLFLVGIDTTSVALSSTIYQLTRNKEAQECLRSELKKALPSKEDRITPETLERIPFLKACIKETLRMYPVILGNGRCLQSDIVLEGYNIPKGTHVIFPHYVLSNDSEHVTLPDKFVPERWMKSNHVKNLDNQTSGCPHMNKQQQLNKIHPFVSLPFGYGRRTCLGKRFADAELQIMLAKIFRNYEVDYNYGPLTYRVSPTYVPVEPLKFRLRRLED